MKRYRKSEIDTPDGYGVTVPGVAVPEQDSVAMSEIVGNMTEGLLALAVGAGLQVMSALMDADVTALAGVKGRHDADRRAVRHRHRRGLGDGGGGGERKPADVLARSRTGGRPAEVEDSSPLSSDSDPRWIDDWAHRFSLAHSQGLVRATRFPRRGSAARAGCRGRARAGTRRRLRRASDQPRRRARSPRRAQRGWK